MTAASVPWQREYEALVQTTGLVDLGHRTQIELRGDDRATFLHNLCTNEIRKLPAGAGCEAFITSVQGKTLAHGFIFVDAQSIVFDTSPGQGERLLAHFDHYLVSEQVTLADQSSQCSELLLSGPTADEVLQKAGAARLAASRLAHQHVEIGGRAVWARRVDLVGPQGILLSAASPDEEAVRATIESAGAVPCGGAAFEAARVEWGFPVFGQDITESNLPQEVARDSQAISYVKGCYLGQETVARIDALGHVNQTLVALRFAAEAMPTAGLELTAEARKVGHVTSAAYSPRLGRWCGLGYVRRGSNLPGSTLGSAAGPVEVVKPPAS
ncbi:MAG TPA: glycine cleavage T C-terminal barrel domain-containing protein [Pirellulales bacterium]|jgi:folate-binding protein YgfZ|nr:glycine cleavage T C-terminal barrel domain-containing protein [Pirellulales bacterium]